MNSLDPLKRSAALNTHESSSERLAPDRQQVTQDQLVDNNSDASGSFFSPLFQFVDYCWQSIQNFFYCCFTRSPISSSSSNKNTSSNIELPASIPDVSALPATNMDLVNIQDKEPIGLIPEQIPSFKELPASIPNISAPPATNMGSINIQDKGQIGLIPEQIPSFKEFNHIVKTRRTEFHAKVPNMPDRDRYADITPYRFNQVLLDPTDSQSGTIPTNGSRITYTENLPQSAQYIAISAPLPSSFSFFMKMLAQEKTSLVLSLTDFEESGAIKADPYLPYNLEESVTYPDYTITCTQVHAPIELSDGWVLEQRDFHLELTDGVVHDFTQLHLPHWKDHTPGTIEGIRALVEYVFDYRKDHAIKTPIVVHCSAGIGRTGVFINSSQAYEQFLAGQEVDLLEIAVQSRLQRTGLGGVRKEQYEMVHKVCLAFGEVNRNEIG